MKAPNEFASQPIEDDASASTDLIAAAAYDELRVVARNHLERLASAATLHPTALVHEAYIKMAGQGTATWVNRRHFFGAATRVMRNIVIDHLRYERRIKRGGGRHRVELDSTVLIAPNSNVDRESLTVAMNKLQSWDPRKADVVTLRFLAGMTIEEAAAVLGMSCATVEREWRSSRAWLRRELAET
jgi:RNA polymerase sigma factor (TIGR02999 family)